MNAKLLKAVILVSGCMFLFAGPLTTRVAHAAAGDLEQVRRLIILSGAAQPMLNMTDQMIDLYKASMPQIPDSFWEEARNNISAFDLLEKMAESHARHLTDSDVRQLIQFYESPVGQKLVRVQPSISIEAMQAGKQWGESVALAIEQKLQERGFTK